MDMDKCSGCHSLTELRHSIHDGSKICADCYRSLRYRLCHSCNELFPLKHMNMQEKKCTGCLGRDKHDAMRV